ncbi:hypothetical protein F4808DRAFT_444938 [Astrocystis sublimbata]|nr:hypothetical protein F4808DRAFT_444938 [Astrocystis sublimbata]
MVAQFNTEIAKADVNNASSIQFFWARHQNACAKPNTEFDIPIVCQTARIGEGYTLPALGEEFDAFKKCCPPPTSGTFHDDTQWVTGTSCFGQVCFTKDEDLAMNFDECIYNAGVDAIKKSMPSHAANATKNAYRGSCEYIDFDSLNKGVQKSDGGAQRVVSWVLVAATLTTALLGPAIM